MSGAFPRAGLAMEATLIASLWQGIAISLLAGLVLTAMGNASAILRHAVAFILLLSMPAFAIGTFMDHFLATGETAVSSDFALRTMATPLPMCWLWLAGVVFNMVRLAFGSLRLQDLERRSAQPLSGPWMRRVVELKQVLGVRRQIDVRLVADVVPCTARLLRPVIWLPVTMFVRLTPDQIEAVIAHELAHIRRLDWLWNQLQCWVETLFFYHPGVWWLSRRIRIERENACDDLAAAAVGEPLIVAEALGELEALRGAALAQSIKGGDTVQRVARLLNRDRPWRAPLGALVAAGIVLGFTLHLTQARAVIHTPLPPFAVPSGTSPVIPATRAPDAHLAGIPNGPVRLPPSLPAKHVAAPPPLPSVPRLNAPPPPALPTPPPPPRIDATP